MKHAESVPRAKEAHLVQFWAQKARVNPFKTTLLIASNIYFTFSFTVLTDGVCMCVGILENVVFGERYIALTRGLRTGEQVFMIFFFLDEEVAGRLR